MRATVSERALRKLEKQLEGELHTGEVMRTLYATDASAYQEMPLAVAIPHTDEDLQALILFANKHQVGLIPRTAGTSLAGQVVGSGIVVDVSRHFTEILEIDPDEGSVTVQPGVIRNELNMALKPYGLYFGPETSTQNRAMIGGMLGNNSCGSNSVKYGSVRDHVMEVRGFLSDGSEVVFGPLTPKGFEDMCEAQDCLETQIYRGIREMLGTSQNRNEIRRGFPKPSIPRRNTGYALDLLMDCEVFDEQSEEPFNFCQLIAGSEGTLFFATEIKLHCNPLPPGENALLCAHFDSVDEALRATLVSVKHDVYAVELIDKYILDCTKRSLEHRHNRFFVQGDPGAILVTELRGADEAALRAQADAIITGYREAELGYHFPILFGEDTVKVWNLRKAGLGLLSNIPGDAKPVPVVEDTAVAVEDLPDYIAEFNRRLKERFGLECVHYAHAGSGEIHLRPIIDLKTEEGNAMFRGVAETIAELVKEYRGSLSGEHGDGRLRGEFLKQMIGEHNYGLVERVKRLWDPNGIFNPGKIVDTPPMNSSLRYTPGQNTPEFHTVFDFRETKGILRAAEMCNGSGDCRKTQLAGGTMCPSYMATRNEKDTTRARANILRNVLTNSTKENPFDSEEIKEVMDLCLSCKGCKSECPSTVDVAKLKAEFLQHYYDANGIPLRTRMIARFADVSRYAAKVPWLWNTVVESEVARRVINRLSGFHPERSLPRLHKQTLRRWLETRPAPSVPKWRGSVYLFVDEFTNYNDVPVGIAAVELLEGLGYEVKTIEHPESGRAALSKGLLWRARRFARANVAAFREIVSEETPLIGLEPSALLCFRDEYVDLLYGREKRFARELAPNALLLEEFLMREHRAGRITEDEFEPLHAHVHLHGHCQQKALAGQAATRDALSLIPYAHVKVIPSGCCGMAGSFGYEKEHYALSQQVGELVLYPYLRTVAPDEVIAAPGTSCRHQIHDGTKRIALHPAQILRSQLKSLRATEL